MAPEPVAIADVDFSLNRQFLESSAGGRPLRVGVLLNGDEVPAYARRALDDIAQSRFAELTCFVSNSWSPPKPPPRGFLGKVASRLGNRLWWRQLLYTSYERWYDARFTRPGNPLRSVSCADLMESVPTLRVEPNIKGFVDRLSEADVERLRGLDLDVLLRFGFRILRGSVLSAARHGIWSFHHGDSERYRGGPALMWELVERNPVSGVILQILEESLDAGPVLAKALFGTAPTLSVTENRFVPYWSCQHFVIRTLHELHERGAAKLMADRSVPREYRGHRPIYRTPRNAEMLAWLAPEVTRRGARRIGRRIRRAFSGAAAEPVWKIGLRRTRPALPGSPAPRDLTDFQWHAKPAGGYWADPFVVRRGQESWLFFEDYLSGSAMGVISCARIDDSGSLGEPRTVLERPYHLSYPHVFEHDGEMFMVPESQRSGTIDLFRAQHFPDRWVHETTLLNISAVDSTPFFSQGLWWMMVSPRIVAGAVAMTYVWSAPSLQGPWKLASHQPIANDVRQARGAGRVFLHDGQLWRPSQDCGAFYGRALVFNRIDGLGDPPAETQVATVEPQGVPDLLGIHTYNRTESWETIDGLFAR